MANKARFRVSPCSSTLTTRPPRTPMAYRGDREVGEGAAAGSMAACEHAWKASTDVLAKHPIVPRQSSLIPPARILRHHARHRCYGSAPQRPFRWVLPRLVGQRLHTLASRIRERDRRLRLWRANRRRASGRLVVDSFTLKTCCQPLARPAVTQSVGKALSLRALRRRNPQSDRSDGNQERWVPLGPSDSAGRTTSFRLGIDGSTARLSDLVAKERASSWTRSKANHSASG